MRSNWILVSMSVGLNGDMQNVWHCIYKNKKTGSIRYVQKPWVPGDVK